jgi:hypothetical protein
MELAAKINGFVYRNGEQLYLVDLVTEKQYKIKEKQYDVCDNKGRLREESIALCWCECLVGETYKTTPVIIVDLTYAGDRIKANRLYLDSLITCAYQASILYTKNRKEKEKILAELPFTEHTV